MKVTVEKVDDINIILSGIIKSSMIEERFALLKEQTAANNDETKDEKLQEEVESQVLQEFIDAGIKEANIDVKNVLGQPGFRKYEKQEDNIYYEVEISTNPEINVNIAYADVIPTYTKPSIESQDVDNRLKEMAIQQAPFTKIKEDRAVEDSDVIVIDFKGFIDSQPFEGGSADNFKLKVGSNSFIPGFEEQTIGMKANDEKTISIRFPKDYVSADLAGKETQFIVKLHEIQEQKAMTIDDNLAQTILKDETATLDILKEKLKDQLASQELSALYRNELKPKIIEGLLKKFNFTLPNNIVEQEIDAKVHEILQQMNKEELELQKNDKEKFHALRDSVRDEARASIKIALIVEALANKEDIVVEESDVIDALGYQAMMTGQDAKELIKYHQDNNLMTSVQMGLAKDKLFGKMLGFYSH